MKGFKMVGCGGFNPVKAAQLPTSSEKGHQEQDKAAKIKCYVHLCTCFIPEMSLQVYLT